MKVISQKKFNINSDSVEISDHATPTIIIEIKTLGLFQATKSQEAYAVGKKKNNVWKPRLLRTCWSISGHFFAEERFSRHTVS